LEAGRSASHLVRRIVLTARLIAETGYRAVYLSGSLQHAMRGYADINALTMSEMVQTAHNVAGEIAIPCIADAETGFGIDINVTRTVREFERTGVAGIHIEDSTVPKRPARLGFESPTVSTAEFLDKIKAALDARIDQGLVVIARSELRGNDDEKIERLHRALELGADAVWVGGFSPSQVEKSVPAVAEARTRGIAEDDERRTVRSVGPEDGGCARRTGDRRGSWRSARCSRT